MALLVLGLAVSIPLIVAGAALIMALLDRFPVLIWAGAALLGWIVGEVIATDPVIEGWLVHAYGASRQDGGIRRGRRRRGAGADVGGCRRQRTVAGRARRCAGRRTRGLDVVLRRAPMTALPGHIGYSGPMNQTVRDPRRQAHRLFRLPA